jgi:hypothetical protein
VTIVNTTRNPARMHLGFKYCNCTPDYGRITSSFGQSGPMDCSLLVRN